MDQLDYKTAGFTLVELMISVAIIGVLAAVAVPGYRTYQAKAKTAEAKIQLAAAYTSLEAFYATYGLYHSCLEYMGFDPSNEIESRFFAIGFNVTANIDASSYANAVQSGMSSSTCTANLAPTSGLTYFPAGKHIGNFGLITEPYAADTSLGTQASSATMTFSVGATGAVSTAPTNVESSSRWSINEKKILRNHNAGY